jgi:hypothetical protein
MTPARTHAPTRRSLRRLAAATVAGATILLLGAAAPGGASLAESCSAPAPSGRLVCVTVEDLDGVSPSGVTTSGKRSVDVQAYQYYKLTIRNSGGNTLTQGSATVALTDAVAGSPTASTASFVASGSSANCAPASGSGTVVCPLPNMPAGAETGLVVAYRTSTTPGVTATTAAITTSFKEGANQGANPAAFTAFETTSLEPEPQLSVAWSPAGQSVGLGTSPADTQFSTLKFTVPGGKAAFRSSLQESDGFVCAPELEGACFGQLVVTDLSGAAAGTFSPTNPFALTMTVSLDIAPALKDLAISHKRDDGTFEVIRTRCASTPPAAGDALPCFTPTKDNKEKLLVLQVFAYENGSWMP